MSTVTIVRAVLIPVLLAALVAALVVLTEDAHAAEAPAPRTATPLATTRTWNFEARLDGKPIGEHRFTVSEDGAQRTVTSEAAFAVKLLGLTVYRYAFSATERWTGDCLQQLVANTDDDGTPARIRADADGERLRIRDGRGELASAGCVMTYAYWNPAALKLQTRLLNPQTGRVEPVTVSPAGAGTVDVGTRRVEAVRFRIAAPVGPVDVWTTAAGDWIGLDAQVKGGRTLSYRLREMPAAAAPRS